MRALNEIDQQIERVDCFLQEAYAENNLVDIVLFAGLMSKLVAKKAQLENAASPNREPVCAWKNIAGSSLDYEGKILSRDERETIDF